MGQQLSLERSLMAWVTEVEAEGQKWAFLEGLTGVDTYRQEEGRAAVTPFHSGGNQSSGRSVAEVELMDSKAGPLSTVLDLGSKDKET